MYGTMSSRRGRGKGEEEAGEEEVAEVATQLENTAIDGEEDASGKSDSAMLGDQQNLNNEEEIPIYHIPPRILNNQLIEEYNLDLLELVKDLDDYNESLISYPFWESFCDKLNLNIYFD